MQTWFGVEYDNSVGRSEFFDITIIHPNNYLAVRTVPLSAYPISSACTARKHARHSTKKLNHVINRATGSRETGRVRAHFNFTQASTVLYIAQRKSGRQQCIDTHVRYRVIQLATCDWLVPVKHLPCLWSLRLNQILIQLKVAGGVFRRPARCSSIDETLEQIPPYIWYVADIDASILNYQTENFIYCLTLKRLPKIRSKTIKVHCQHMCLNFLGKSQREGRYNDSRIKSLVE